ncbi:hypothetical protein [Pseudoruegeria sp. HB172150]|uniref:hypothetical protein n=1 Tax=Pseudoruegeria sp. HB172150 TaxID=2721164 RepID=UPI0015579472|nr:hypothetical protein [Pseudoruegeria sp. HB172150]
MSKKRRNRGRWPVALPILLAWLGGMIHQVHAQDVQAPWSGQISLYGWDAGAGGEIIPFEGGPTFAFDPAFLDFLDGGDAAFFLSFLAHRNRLVFYADYSNSTGTRSGEIARGIEASGELSLRSATVAIGRRVVREPTGTVDLLAGARVWEVGAKVDVPSLGISTSGEQPLGDPIIGIRAEARLSPAWSVTGYFDVGGFDVVSDFTSQAVVTANHALTDDLSLSLGYRHVYLRLEHDGAILSNTLSGPMFGLSWRF